MSEALSEVPNTQTNLLINTNEIEPELRKMTGLRYMEKQIDSIVEFLVTIIPKNNYLSFYNVLSTIFESSKMGSKDAIEILETHAARAGLWDDDIPGRINGLVNKNYDNPQNNGFRELKRLLGENNSVEEVEQISIDLRKVLKPNTKNTVILPKEDNSDDDNIKEEKISYSFKQIGNISRDDLDKNIEFIGILKSVPANHQPYLSRIDFKECCPDNKNFIKGNYFEPPKIIQCTCGAKRLVVKESYEDFKLVEIEEPVEDYVSANHQPISFKLLLKGDLSRNKPVINPGDNLRVKGVLKTLNKKGKIHYIIDADSVDNITNDDAVLITDADVKKIHEVKESLGDGLIKKLGNAILPNLMGFSHIKEGILYQLFGLSDDEGKRGQLHILFAGDPGVSKTQILLRVNKLIPKTSYAVGGTSTAAGLLGTVKQQEITGDWVAEPGIIVKTHKGILCLDEIDKLHNTVFEQLNEPMEQQTITLNKAGLTVQYPAQTSILGALNPKKGYFEKSVDAISQIKLPQTFFDRFDLIFILQDKVEYEKDDLIISSILRGDNRKNLSDDFLRKYVTYAKNEFPNPELGMDAETIIREYVHEFRQERDPVIIKSHRLAEVLLRITKSISRIHLRDTIIESDAVRAVELYKNSLNSFILDERIKTPVENVLEY